MDDRLEREREFHDRVYSEQARRPTGHFYSATASLAKWYRETLNAHAPGAQVLEYGCGAGSLAFELARNGAHVVGIDLSPVAIERASERGRAEGLEAQLEFRVMNAEQLDFPDENFDLVCGSGILHHLDLARSYAELARVLRGDGVGVFGEPLGHNPAINAYRNRTPELRTVDEHPLRVDDLALAERFFNDVETRFFTLSSLAAVPLRGLPGFERLLSGLDGLDRLLFRVAPPLRRHAWMVGMTLRGPRHAEAGAGT